MPDGTSIFRLLLQDFVDLGEYVAVIMPNNQAAGLRELACERGIMANDIGAMIAVDEHHIERIELVGIDIQRAISANDQNEILATLGEPIGLRIGKRIMAGLFRD